MKLLLYGIGRELDNIEARIKKGHRIIGYMDSYATIKMYRDKPFYTLSSINSLDFDYVIITIKNRRVAWDIQQLLVDNFEIPLEKVIPFWVYAKRELWKRKMESHNLKQVRGMIFGNSHAAYGFLEEELWIPFINLAVSSQDLYYMYHVFNKSIETFGDKIKNLEYIVIDLYDYIEFNIDISMTSYYLDYMYNGGLQGDEHNYKKNKNFNNPLTEEMFKNYYVILEGEKQESLDHIFDNCNTEFDTEPNNRWYHIEADTWLPAGPIIGTVTTKRFDYTVQENLNIIVKFIEKIRSVNHKMKIVFTLLPKYITVEKATELSMGVWKEEFEQIISDICSNYQIHFLNYKDKKDISNNHMFYYDPRHLNTIGARAVTAILNEDLKQL